MTISLAYVMGHELGHIMSDHVLYRTMTVLLIQARQHGLSRLSDSPRGRSSWHSSSGLRKSELSSDRAGLLAVQNPQRVMATMLKMAGGGEDDEMNLDEFIIQAEEYRESGDVADQVFKVLNLMGQSHPFYVLQRGRDSLVDRGGRIRPDPSGRIHSTVKTRTRPTTKILKDAASGVRRGSEGPLRPGRRRSQAYGR